MDRPPIAALPESLEVEPQALLETVRRAKADAALDMLIDVTAVDWPERKPRFDVVYQLYSTTTFKRLRIRTRVDEADPVVASLYPLYGSALFMERECHEMYGIRFDGHPDLRPILLYEGFHGHPLRKDYPIDQQQPLVPFRK